MLTIDLLKGRGIPIKSKPGGTALLAITIAMPIVAAFVLLGDYMHGRIILLMHEESLENIVIIFFVLEPQCLTISLYNENIFCIISIS